VSVVVTPVAAFGVITGQWIGPPFTPGIVGFAVTFALQQPLFSLIRWFHITVKRPYQVGDRIAIEDSSGDVVEVDFFVTTVRETNGELASSNQPSGLSSRSRTAASSPRTSKLHARGFPLRLE